LTVQTKDPLMNQIFKILSFLLISVLFCGKATADSTVVGLGAGGLEFRSTESVSMIKERLTISPQKIDAQYIFKNITDQPVELMVAFPLPVIDFKHVGGHGPYINISNSNHENYVDFKTIVDGQAVHTKIESKALLGDKDISAELKKLGISYWIPGHGPGDREIVRKQLAQLDRGIRQRLIKAGFIQAIDDRGVDGELMPSWRLVTLYYWTQIFPVGKNVSIQHIYKPVPSLSEGFSALLYDYQNKPLAGFVLGGTTEARYPKDANHLKQYCMTDGFWAEVKRKTNLSAFQSNEINFILKTANAWHKPIGEFTLVLQTLKPENLVSLCIDGIKQTSATSFEVTKRNFAPDKDIKVFFLTLRD